MGIVVGSVVDGVLESMILGIQVGTGAVISLGFVAAVFISNIPQAIVCACRPRRGGLGPAPARSALAAGRARLRGRRRTRLPGDRRHERRAGRPRGGLAVGGLLAMLTNSLIPFSFERGGRPPARRPRSASASRS